MMAKFGGYTKASVASCVHPQLSNRSVEVDLKASQTTHFQADLIDESRLILNAPNPSKLLALRAGPNRTPVRVTGVALERLFDWVRRF